MAVKLKENIYWVGVVDWDIRDFHSHETPFGTTYNSYLITGEKNILIDTCKEELCSELIFGISEVINPKKIDYIIAQHSEKDHSGCLEDIVKISGAKVITNEKGKELLSIYYNTDNWEFIIVNDNTTLKLGDKSFKFILTPMLHWPDNMMTYCIDDKILFSNDAFGQHFASSKRFDYEIKNYSFHYAKEYFANILMPYKSMVPDIIEKLKCLELDMIAPAHGVIWCKYINNIIKKYEDWIFNVKNKAVIVYDSMYGSTRIMAHSLACGLMERGVETKVYDVSKTSISKIVTDVLDCKYLLIGSPTMNRNVTPNIGKFLTYLMNIRPYDKIGVAFGSYGWVECAVNKIKTVFLELYYKIVEDKCLTIRLKPTTEDIKKLKEFGRKLADIDYD